MNFVSFTPGTSFNMASRGGTSQERAVIFRLLEYVLEAPLERPGAYRTLRNYASDQNFRWEVGNTPRVGSDDGRGLDLRLANAFRAELRAHPSLLDRFWRFVEISDDRDESDRHEREVLIGDLR